MLVDIAEGQGVSLLVTGRAKKRGAKREKVKWMSSPIRNRSREEYINGKRAYRVAPDSRYGTLYIQASCVAQVSPTPSSEDTDLQPQSWKARSGNNT